MSEETHGHEPGRVVWTAHGVVIYGPVGIGDMADYIAALAKVGLLTCDLHIGSKIGALMAMPYPGHHRAWREELGLSVEGDLGSENPPVIIGKTTGKKRGKR